MKESIHQIYTEATTPVMENAMVTGNGPDTTDALGILAKRHQRDAWLRHPVTVELLESLNSRVRTIQDALIGYAGVSNKDNGLINNLLVEMATITAIEETLTTGRYDGISKGA